MPGRLLEARPDRLIHAEPTRRGTDDVAEHGAGFDRRQLLVVADEDQARVGTECLEEPGHHGQGDHGGLVHDDHVVAERVRRVVPEPGPVAAGAPEEPMQRHPAELQEPLLRARVQVQPECLVAHRFFQPQRRLARRRRQGDERRGGALGERLLMEQRQQPGHGRGLSRPRSSGDDRDAPENGGGSGQRLQVIGILRLRVDLAEQRRQAGAQERQVDVDHVALGPGQEFRRHPSFVEPEAVQVEVRPRQPERAALPDQRALVQCVEPRLGIGPRQRVEVGRQVDVPAGRLPDGPQVDAHMAEPRRPGGEGDPEGDVPASPSTPASCAKRCAMWTSALSRIPARLKARRLPDAPAATDAS